MAEQIEARRVKAFAEASILAKANVVGVGVGYKVQAGRVTDQLSVMVLVRRKVPRAGLAAEALVSPEIEGVPTDVIEVGDLRALQARTDRWRPAPAGVSMGHYTVTAGTFGAVVRARSTGARLLLSNNHVFANSNDASPGDAILQPGAADGGHEPSDTLARLERFCPIQFRVQPGVCNLAAGVTDLANALARALGSRHRLQAFQSDPDATNLVDAAVARPLDDADIHDEILEIGTVNGTAPAMLAMDVRKSGRSTGLTTGEITVLNTTVDVSYGPGRVARFEDQLVTGPMSAPGDSGSLLVAGDSLKAVGLLFAGSEQATIYNPIQAVLDCLEVAI